MVHAQHRHGDGHPTKRPGATPLGGKANTHIEGVEQGLGGHLGSVGKSMREFGGDVVAVMLEEAVQQALLPEDLSQLLPPFQGQPGTSTKEKNELERILLPAAPASSIRHFQYLP